MTFTPPKKRTHGQCNCYIVAPVNGGHLPDCPALYPLQPQPGGTANAPEPDDVAKVRAGLELGVTACGRYVMGDESRAALDRLSARVQHLEAHLNDYERAAVIANDHQSRALRMGQQQGRAELAQELCFENRTSDPLPTWAVSILSRELRDA